MTTEYRATNELLQRGVRVKARAPLLLRLILIKHITLHIRPATFGALLRMGRWYLSAGIMQSDLEDVTVEKAMALMVRKGEYISKAVASALLRDKWRTKLFLRPYARWLRESLPPSELLGIMQIYVLQGGLEDFIVTTRLVSGKTISSPKLGQKTKKS